MHRTAAAAAPTAANDAVAAGTASSRQQPQSRSSGTLSKEFTQLSREAQAHVKNHGSRQPHECADIARKVHQQLPVLINSMLLPEARVSQLSDTCLVVQFLLG
jgi:hypothetical protein